MFKIIRLLTILLLHGLPASLVAQKPAFIEFGWNYPDVDQLSRGLLRMQNTPFDGISFSLQRNIMEAFDTIVRPPSYFEYDKLSKLQWGKYTDNYIILRGFGITGGRWYDDKAWNIFTVNMRSLSRAMAVGDIKGILFDPEYYYENQHFNPWTYSEKQYPGKNYPAVQAAVKKRGIQFIKALQQHKASFSFLSIWLASLIAEEKKYTPLQDTRHALLFSFIEGMLEGKNKSVTIIEGNEYAYWNFTPSQFIESGQFLRKNMVELMTSSKAKKEAAKIPVAQTIFYDGIMARAPSFENGFDNITRWKWLEENTRYAMATASGVVWFYGERINWWDGKVNDTLTRILHAAKNNAPHVITNKRATAPIARSVNGNVVTAGPWEGYFYSTDPKTPMSAGNLAFTMKWHAANKSIEINFIDETPTSFVMYVNDLPSAVIQPRASSINIQLDNFKKGNLIVLAKYADKREATGILIL